MPARSRLREGWLFDQVAMRRRTSSDQIHMDEDGLVPLVIRQ